jgi:hypothetical protein
MIDLKAAPLWWATAALLIFLGFGAPSAFSAEVGGDANIRAISVSSATIATMPQVAACRPQTAALDTCHWRTSWRAEVGLSVAGFVAYRDGDRVDDRAL